MAKQQIAEHKIAKKQITLTINGDRYDVMVEPYDSLNYVLREIIGITGTKRGCDTGGCGVCTIEVDGEYVYSCMFPAIRGVGKDIMTIEGLLKDGKMHQLQESFVRLGAIQCGYCTPGMIMAGHSILKENPTPTEEEIREGLAGNLCRCTGYVKIVEAIQDAVAKSR